MIVCNTATIWRYNTVMSHIWRVRFRYSNEQPITDITHANEYNNVVC